jgi:hypothetical protein
MSTYTIHPHGRHHETSWSTSHPLIATVMILAAAVVVGVLAGILFSLLADGTRVAPVHRVGGHGHPTVAAALHAAAAAAAVESSGGAVSAAASKRERSPARSGFAVGTTAGAGDGFFTIAPGTRAPARGGFPRGSLGAGHVPGGALARSTASG